MSEDSDDGAFGRAIREAREAARLSVRTAAAAAGMSEGRWRQLELGYQTVTSGVRVPARPRERTARQMAEAVGLDPGEGLRLAGFHEAAERVARRSVGPDVQGPGSRPVLYGLDDEAAGLTEKQIESVRAVIRAMRPALEDR